MTQVVIVLPIIMARLPDWFGGVLGVAAVIALVAMICFQLETWDDFIHAGIGLFVLGPLALLLGHWLRRRLAGSTKP